MSDELREMLAESMKEAEGKTESVVETAAKLEPEQKKEEAPAPEKVEVKTEAPKPEPTVEEAVKAASTEEPEKATTDVAKTEEPLLAQDKPPSGWTPKAREMWATLPKEIREEVTRREEASAIGVRKLQAETEPMRGFVQQLSPFIQEAAQNGQNPASYIGQVMAAERALRSPDEHARFEALLAIADSYNIPLREVINKSVGREVVAARPQAQAPAIPKEVERELAENRQWREQQEQQAMINEIEAFKKDHEFFEDARPMMANLITANPTMTLKEAYEAAIWANPTIREVMQSRQAKKVDPIAEKQKAAVKASSSGNEEIHVRTRAKNEESTLEDDLRESMIALQGRT